MIFIFCFYSEKYKSAFDDSLAKYRRVRAKGEGLVATDRLKSPICGHCCPLRRRRPPRSRSRFLRSPPCALGSDSGIWRGRVTPPPPPTWRRKGPPLQRNNRSNYDLWTWRNLANSGKAGAALKMTVCPHARRVNSEAKSIALHCGERGREEGALQTDRDSGSGQVQLPLNVEFSH